MTLDDVVRDFGRADMIVKEATSPELNSLFAKLVSLSRKAPLWHHKHILDAEIFYASRNIPRGGNVIDPVVRIKLDDDMLVIGLFAVQIFPMRRVLMMGYTTERARDHILLLTRLNMNERH